MKIKLSEYLKYLILNGKAHHYFDDGWVTYDQVRISQDKVEFLRDEEVLGYMDIPIIVDLSAGNTLTIDLGESKNKIGIE